MKAKILAAVAATLLAGVAQPAMAALYTFTYAFSNGVDTVTGTVDGTYNANGGNPYLSGVTVQSISYNGTAFVGSPFVFGKYDADPAHDNMWFAALSNNFLIKCDTAFPATCSGSPYQYFLLRPANQFGGPNYYNDGPNPDINIEDRDYSLANPMPGTWSLVEGATAGPPTVPLPAAAWLLLSGIAGLGALRRRKTH